MATIDPNQQYDIIHTLTFAEASGNCPIRLYRGSLTATSGTVYYRAGTSGDWTTLSVSGTSTTFPVTDTTMQVAHNWDKLGNNYMTPSFRDATNITSIAISQKSALTGTMGNYFMYSYAYGCSSLTSLDVPDTSGLTSVGTYFMYYYAYNCSSLTSLDVPDTSSLESAGNAFMYYYAYGCSSLASLDVPDTSGLTSVGDSFMYYYARGCSSLTSLAVPDISSLESVGNYFMYSYAEGCSSLESLDVPDTSGLESVGNAFMYSYARGCSSLTSLAVPDTSSLESVGYMLFMYYYAEGCSSLTKLVLPAVGWFEDNNVNWSVPAGRLGVLEGHVLDSDDLISWKALTAEGKTLHTNYIRTPDLVYYGGTEPAHDIIHTLTFSEASGDCPIRLHRGSSSAISGTVYYRAGTSGDWTTLSVSGTSTTFPVTDTTMQVAHNWDKLGNNYMTPSFRDATNITSIAISQKSALTGTMGDYFMCYYAYGCSSLESLAVPDTSGLESVGDYFMRSYANGCSSLTSLAVPNTSGLTSVGNAFMVSYAEGCSKLTSLDVPNTSGLESVGYIFMYYYASGCSSLTKLVLPAVGWFQDNNVDWSVPSGRLGNLEGHVLDSSDLSDWKALTAEGKTLHTNYIRTPDLVYYGGTEPAVTTLPATSVGHDSATLNGSLVSLGFEPSVDVYFEFRKTGASTWSSTTAQAKTTRDTFSANISGLDASTEYEFRAVVEWDSGAETAYGGVAYFETGAWTEYCEYVADLIRTIIQSQSYNADTKRSIAQSQAYQADTFRKINKAYQYPADTERITLKDYAYSADTKRKIIQDHVFAGDTKRGVIKEYTFTADTLRKLKKSYEYQADILRQVVKSYDYTADVLRRIAEEAQYQADAKRQIAKEYSYPADAERKILQDYDYSTDTFRKVLKEYGYNADAKRMIIKTDARNADLLRRIVKQYEYSADTMRFVVELGIYVGDTYRVVRADQVYSADALRQAIKEYEFIADTLRHVIMPYTQLIITTSIQERQIDLSTQEREVKLGVEQMSLIGNTVRLQAEFKDFNGEHVSPENVILRIYDGYKNQVGEDIPVLPSDVGKYQYDYVIPDVIGALYFEFVGTIGELPILGRATIDKRWI